MAANHAPNVETIELIEAPTVQPRPQVGTSRENNDRKGFETVSQPLPEPVQQRSTYRTVTIMVALFVSKSLVDNPKPFIIYSFLSSLNTLRTLEKYSSH